MKKISVITVTYNAGEYIKDTVESVLAQNYSNLEYIVIDGMSNDNTVSIVKHYEPEIKVISERDNGIYDAMNKGVDISTGDYVLFLQAGDLLQDGVIESLSSYFEDNECAFIYGNVGIRNNGLIIGGEFDKIRIMKENISQQAIIYSRSIFDRVGKHDIKYNVHADWILNAKCFADASIKKIFVDKMVSKVDIGYSKRNVDGFVRWKRMCLFFRLFGIKYAIIYLIICILNLFKKCQASQSFDWST